MDVADLERNDGRVSNHLINRVGTYSLYSAAMFIMVKYSIS